MRIIHALLVAILLLCSSKQGNAAYHYCFEDGTMMFSMLPDTDQPERLVTNIRADHDYLPDHRCEWKVRLREMTQPRQMVLQPEITGMMSETSKCNFTLSLTIEGKKAGFSREWKSTASLPSFPLILPIQSSAEVLKVQFTAGTTLDIQQCGRVELLIQVAKKGYCDRYMLMYGGRCHLVSDNELSLRDTMHKDGARLTAFSGIEHIEEFIRANDNRTQLYPYIRPLNFSSPMRVGVFFCPKTFKSAYWKSDGNGSFVPDIFKHSLHSLRKTEFIGQCAFIQTSTNGTLQLGFSDCSQPMRALLSFPEIPSNQSTDGIPPFLNVSDVCAPPPSKVKTNFILVTVVICLAGNFTVNIVAAARFFIIRIRKSSSKRVSHEMESFLSKTSGTTQNEIGQNQQRENEHESTEVRQEGVKIQIDISANTTIGSLDCASVRNLRSQDEHNQTQENRQWNTDNGQERVDSQMGSSENAAGNRDTVGLPLSFSIVCKSLESISTN